MLPTLITKDIVIFNNFIKFLNIYAKSVTPSIVAHMPNDISFGIYMNFLEQQYNIGITADNYSYILYYIAVNEDNKHYNSFIKHMKENNNNIIIHQDLVKECSTVINRYVDGICKAIELLILPF